MGASVDGDPSGDAAALQFLLERTAHTTGDAYFSALVQALVDGLDLAGALVAETRLDSTRLHVCAFATRGRLREGFELPLAGSVLVQALEPEGVFLADGASLNYPADALVAETQAVAFQGVPLADASGRVLGCLALYSALPFAAPRSKLLRTFAARGAAELARLAYERSVRESEQRFRDLFDQAPVGYVYEDTHTRFLEANEAAQRILGLKPEEVSQTVGLSLVAPTVEAQSRVTDSLIAEQEGREKPYIVLELRRKSDGKPVWIQRYSRPEPDGKHTRTMLVDITEQVLAERERARLSQQNDYLRDELKEDRNFEQIIGHSETLNAVLSKVSQVAKTDATVLLLGETGTGKELIARALHSGSNRKSRPLIKLNCAALPSGLVESELFGHEKGAFTGATERRPGRFALADGGTIFLDEIGDVTLDVQVRLLRVLQEREFEPVGATRSVRVDVRTIAATNRDLEQAVSDGEFRRDLFYRLNVFPIVVPPLRERRDDIELLTHFFIGKYGARIGKRIDRVAPETLKLLYDYPWPGNIRELENVVERAVILSDGETLVVEPSILHVTQGYAPETLLPAAPSLTKDGILKALERAGWRIEGERGAAKALGLRPSTLRSRMSKLGIQRGPGL